MSNIIDSKITLKNNLLYEDTVYIFTLTVNVNDEYIKTIGKPQKGIANIIVHRDLTSTLPKWKPGDKLNIV